MITRRNCNIRNKCQKMEVLNTYVSSRILIMGHSIVKHVKSYKLSRKVENCKVYVKSFSGAKVMCMEDYAKPTMREMFSYILLYNGTNDVPTKKVPEQIAEILLI